MRVRTHDGWISDPQLGHFQRRDGSVLNVDEFMVRLEGVYVRKQHPVPDKCRNGHAMTPDNLVRRNDHKPQCRTCKSAHEREVYAARKIRRQSATQGVPA